jgi:hypothetical protein
MVKFRFWKKKEKEEKKEKKEKEEESELEKAEREVKYVIRKWVRTIDENGKEIKGWFPVEGLVFDYPVSPEEVLPALEDNEIYSLSPLGRDGKYRKAVWVIDTSEEKEVKVKGRRKEFTVGNFIDTLISVSDAVENYQDKFSKALTVLERLSGKGVALKEGDITDLIVEEYEKFRKKAEVFGYVKSSGTTGQTDRLPVKGEVPWQYVYVPELIDKIGDIVTKRAVLFGLVSPKEIKERERELAEMEMKEKKIYEPPEEKVIFKVPEIEKRLEEKRMKESEVMKESEEKRTSIKSEVMKESGERSMEKVKTEEKGKEIESEEIEEIDMEEVEEEKSKKEEEESE